MKDTLSTGGRLQEVNGTAGDDCQNLNTVVSPSVTNTENGVQGAAMNALSFTPTVSSCVQNNPHMSGTGGSAAAGLASELRKRIIFSDCSRCCG